jgi:hypothetical protein
MPASMIEYQWREEASESFGKVKRPIARVHIKDKNGQWRAISMLVDSGADVSIITRSYGELFGHFEIQFKNKKQQTRFIKN